MLKGVTAASCRSKLQPCPFGRIGQRFKQGQAAGQVVDGIFVGRQQRRPLAGLQMASCRPVG